MPNTSRRPTSWPTLRDLLLAHRVQWYKEPWFIERPILTSILSSSGGGKLPLFFLSAPEIKSGQLVWVASALTTMLSHMYNIWFRYLVWPCISCVFVSSIIRFRYLIWPCVICVFAGRILTVETVSIQIAKPHWTEPLDVLKCCWLDGYTRHKYYFLRVFYRMGPTAQETIGRWGIHAFPNICVLSLYLHFYYMKVRLSILMCMPDSHNQWKLWKKYNCFCKVIPEDEDRTKVHVCTERLFS